MNKTKHKTNKKRIANKLILQQSIIKGIPIRDLQKEIRVKWRKEAFIQVKSFSIEEAFFKPCIYYLMAGENIVYIGETDSLMGRVGQHVKENLKVFDGIKFVWFNGTKKERKQKEKMEIEFHKPFYNKTHNQWKYLETEEEYAEFEQQKQKKKMSDILNKITANASKNKGALKYSKKY